MSDLSLGMIDPDKVDSADRSILDVKDHCLMGETPGEVKQAKKALMKDNDWWFVTQPEYESSRRSWALHIAQPIYIPLSTLIQGFLAVNTMICTNS